VSRQVISSKTVLKPSGLASRTSQIISQKMRE
jgi:hypothetical protein